MTHLQVVYDWQRDEQRPTAELADWRLGGMWTVREWGQIIAALTMSPYDGDHELAERINAAIVQSKAFPPVEAS